MLNISQDEIVKNWKKEYTSPVVSVVCITYNQEDYISSALDGFLKQKTDFPFEVLVHDDASTDRTAQIVKSYERKYPKIVKGVYEKKNQYSQGRDILLDIMLPKISGQYVATCEGDDYWESANKLQRSFDYLSTHPKCSMVSHPTDMYVGESTERRHYSPAFLNRGGVLRSATLIIHNDLIHTSSHFYRKTFLTKNLSMFQRMEKLGVVYDVVYVMMAVTEGYVYLLSNVFSVYRYRAKNSWSLMVADNDEKLIEATKVQYYCAKLINRYRKYQYNEAFLERNRRAAFEVYKLRGNLRQLRKNKYRDLYRKMDMFDWAMVIIKNLPKPVYIFIHCKVRPLLLDTFYKIRGTAGFINYKR